MEFIYIVFTIIIIKSKILIIFLKYLYKKIFIIINIYANIVNK